MGSWKGRFCKPDTVQTTVISLAMGEGCACGVGLGSECVLVEEGPQSLFCGSQRITLCVLPYVFHLILLRVSPGIQN